MASCPLCGQDHDGCRWISGSLWCEKAECANPHHRPGGSGEIPAPQHPVSSTKK